MLLCLFSLFLSIKRRCWQTDFFWEVAPGKILLSAAMLSLIISTFLASFWPEGELDGLPVMGLALGDYTLMPLWIWIYCLIWWFIQDAAKVITIRILMSMPRFLPFKVDRLKYEEANKRLPKVEEDGGHH
jgi:H+-transporting ATPase